MAGAGRGAEPKPHPLPSSATSNSSSGIASRPCELRLHRDVSPLPASIEAQLLVVRVEDQVVGDLQLLLVPLEVLVVVLPLVVRDVLQHPEGPDRLERNVVTVLGHDRLVVEDDHVVGHDPLNLRLARHLVLHEELVVEHLHVGPA